MHKAADLADRGGQLRYGDYDQPDSLRDSFNGADQLLFISAPSSDFGERMRQHHNVVDAARTSGVGHLLYTSGLGADVVNEADWPTATPLSGPSETVVCRTRSCGTRSIRSGSSIQVCGGRSRPVSLRAAARAEGVNAALRADFAEADAAVVLTGQIILAEATTSLVASGRLTSWHRSDISGRTITPSGGR
jgi:NAD(P)H dehydrogenase (quinone)